VIVQFPVVNAIEISAESKAFHPSEKIRVMGQYVFKRAMLSGGFAHKDAPAFLKNLGVNNSRAVSKIGDITLASNHCVRRFTIAIRAQRQGSPGYSCIHRRSMLPLQKPSRCPGWGS